MENTMVKELFVDGVSHINFLNGMVRVTYGTLSPNTKDENAEPEFNEKFRLVMPLNSFLAAFQSQHQLIAQLEEKGVITPKTEAETAPTMESIIPETVK